MASNYKKLEEKIESIGQAVQTLTNHYGEIRKDVDVQAKLLWALLIPTYLAVFGGVVAGLVQLGMWLMRIAGS